MNKEQRAKSNAKAKRKRVGFLILLFYLLPFNFSFFQNAHYAYRELEYRNVIEGKTVPAMAVSGEQLIFIINRVLSEQDRGIF